MIDKASADRASTGRSELIGDSLDEAPYTSVKTRSLVSRTGWLRGAVSTASLLLLALIVSIGTRAGGAKT